MKGSHLITWVRKDVESQPRVYEEDEAMASLDRDIGELQEAVSNLRESVRTLATTVAELRSENIKLQMLIAQGKGGWKVLTFIGGLAAAIGALMTKFLPLIMTFPR